MALAPLATAADLAARGIPTDNPALVAAALAAASASVREAAGCPISQVTSTVTLWTEPSQRLDLPSRPVIGVASVDLDGTRLTVGRDYVVRGNALWRIRHHRGLGWSASAVHQQGRLGCKWHADGDAPSEVVVTFTHGLVEVPGDIVDLVCSLVAAGTAASVTGYDPNRNLAYERVDDYQRGFRQGDDEVVNPMLLPERTRAWLRRRFGSGVAVAGAVL